MKWMRYGIRKGRWMKRWYRRTHWCGKGKRELKVKYKINCGRLKVIIIGMIGNLKSVSGYLERRLNTCWTSENLKAKHSEAANQIQSFFNNARTSTSNYIRPIGSRLLLFNCGKFVCSLGIAGQQNV